MVCSHFVGIMNSFSLDAETSLCSWNIPDWANGVWNYTKKQNKTEPNRAQWNAFIMAYVSTKNQRDLCFEAKQIHFGS